MRTNIWLYLSILALQCGKRHRYERRPKTGAVSNGFNVKSCKYPLPCETKSSQTSNSAEQNTHR